MWAVAVQFWQGNAFPNTVLREGKTRFAKEKSTYSEKQKKDLGILTTVSNSDQGSQASGGNSVSHRPGNPVTAVYANYTFGWLSHGAQNKCMSWWSSKLDCSVELKAFTLSETHKRINATTKVTGIQWEKHTSVSCFVLSCWQHTNTNVPHSVLLPFISSLWKVQINPLSNVLLLVPSLSNTLFPVPSLLRK